MIIVSWLYEPAEALKIPIKTAISAISSMREKSILFVSTFLLFALMALHQVSFHSNKFLCASQQAKTKGGESIWINLLLLSGVRKVKPLAAGFVEVIIETKLEKRKDMRTNNRNRRREEEMREKEVEEKCM